METLTRHAPLPSGTTEARWSGSSTGCGSPTGTRKTSPPSPAVMASSVGSVYCPVWRTTTVAERLARPAAAVHLHALDLPVGQPLAVDPALEELAVVAPGVGLQFRPQVLRLQDAPGVLRHKHPGEVQERGLTHPVFDHLEHLRPAVVGTGEQPEQVLVPRQVLGGGVHLVVADGEVRPGPAVVLALDVRQPVELLGPLQQFVVLAVLLVEQAVGEVDQVSWETR
jgi:hypothetical protein